MRTGLLLLLLACAIAAAHSGQFAARVIAVLDGDTILVMRDSGPPVKVRLADIDAPEKEQPGGIASKKSLSELVLHKQIDVDDRATDAYGRLVAHLTADGKSVNEEQVRRGMAWEYSNYHGNKTYVSLQSEAQQARRGLWAGAEIMEPAQWRKLHAAEAPATTLHAKPSVRATEDYTCGSKRHCSQIRSCDEAHFYLSHCGVKSLDPNRDGVPCEPLCAGR
ncbi:MAG: thermonuclease family protein [Pseudomonadota bacterium]